ncbi:MAG: hypothetical protein IJU29_05560 [Oscillospiraceae bacterium]|nr:hypothetical protein [Oscillospiraceae bacterium]
MYNIAVDPILAQEAQIAFRGHGIELGDAVASFLRNSIREMQNMENISKAEMMEKHLRGLEEIEAGGGIHRTLAQLEAMTGDE